MGYKISRMAMPVFGSPKELTQGFVRCINYVETISPEISVVEDVQNINIFLLYTGTKYFLQEM